MATPNPFSVAIEAKVMRPKDIKFVDGPGYNSFYTNNVSFSVNQADVVLIFGEIINVENETAIVERRARITMAPIQAKALKEVLDHVIALHEKQNGPIPDPGLNFPK